MAYPPALPPADRADATLMAGNHAGDHNALTMAVAEVLEALGANPTGAYADLSSRLEDVPTPDQLDGLIAGHAAAGASETRATLDALALDRVGDLCVDPNMTNPAAWDLDAGAAFFTPANPVPAGDNNATVLRFEPSGVAIFATQVRQFGVIPGDELLLDAQVRARAIVPTAGWLWFRVRWFAADGAPLVGIPFTEVEFTYAPIAAGGAGAWKRRTGTIPVPAGAVAGELNIISSLDQGCDVDVVRLHRHTNAQLPLRLRAGQDAANLMADPDVNNPAAWTFSSANAYVADAGTYPPGSRTKAAIRITAPNESATYGVPMRVASGREVLLSAYVRWYNDAPAAGSLAFRATWLDRDDAVISTSDVTVPAATLAAGGNSVWVNRRGSVIAPAGAVAYTLQVLTTGMTAGTWLEVAGFRATLAERPTADLDARHGVGNARVPKPLLSNGSFELAAERDKYPLGINGMTYHAGGDVYGAAKEGAYDIAINTNAGGPGWYPYLQFSDDIPVRPGDQFELTYWSKKWYTSATVGVAFWCLDAAGQVIVASQDTGLLETSPTDPDNAWVQKKRTFTVPAGTYWLRPNVNIRGGGGTDLWFIDDVRMRLVDDTGWLTPAFLNAWVNFGGAEAPAAYRRIGNRVFLRGVIKSGVVGSPAFTLPVGYRPLDETRQPVESNGSVVPLYVGSGNGNVYPLSGTNAKVTLGGVSFLID